jgi:hypothetical protein
MSNAEIVHLDTEISKRRRGLLGTGRHRRTPETWKRMEDELAAAQAKAARMEGERDHYKGRADKFEGIAQNLQGQMSQLQGEVRQMRALMSGDPNNRANQVTHSFTMPQRPVDDSDPAEVVTQPISAKELFEMDPMAPLRPKIRVHSYEKPAPDAAERLISRIVPTAPPVSDNSEKVRHIEQTQVLPLWDSPAMQGYRGARHTA